MLFIYSILFCSRGFGADVFSKLLIFSILYSVALVYIENAERPLLTVNRCEIVLMISMVLGTETVQVTMLLRTLASSP